jgi:hypothetical protein
MKIKLNSEYEEISIMCVKKRGKIKITFIDEDTNEIVSEQIIEDLIIGEEYNIDLDVPKNYDIKEEIKEKSYEDEILEEMKRLRDAMNE